MQRLGVRVRNRLMCALYRKCLKLSPQGLQEETTGKIVTLMSNDVNKLQDLFQLLHNLWGAPIFIVASFVMLYDVIQWSSFVGFAHHRRRAHDVPGGEDAVRDQEEAAGLRGRPDQHPERGDQRHARHQVLRLGERLRGARARDSRQRGEAHLGVTARGRALRGGALLHPGFIAVCSLGSYSLAGKTLNASTAYTALALFNMLRFPLILVPFLLTTLLNALSAVQRLGAFLLQDESPAVPPDMSEPGRVVVNDATFRWPAAPKKPEETVPPPSAAPRSRARARRPGEGRGRRAPGDAVAVAAEAPEQPLSSCRTSRWTSSRAR